MKAKLHRTLAAVGFLKCDLLAYKLGQLIRGSLHEVLPWRLAIFFRSIIVLLQETPHYGNGRTAARFEEMEAKTPAFRPGSRGRCPRTSGRQFPP
jgi:hypothetical protein